MVKNLVSSQGDNQRWHLTICLIQVFAQLEDDFTNLRRESAEGRNWFTDLFGAL
jgi:hypothetical protein